MGAAAVCAILGVVLFLIKDTMLKTHFEHRVSKATGMKAKIEQFHWRLRSNTVAIRNFRLYNGPEFGGTPFLDIPEVHLEFVRSDLASGKLHLKDLRFHLAETHLVKNKEGKFNVNFEEEDVAAKAPEKQKSKPLLEFGGIDTLHLTLGKVFYTDMQNPTNNTAYDLGVQDAVIKNVRTESDLINWLLGHLLAKDRNGLTPSVNIDSPKEHKRSKRVPVAVSTNATGAPVTNSAPATKLPDNKN